MLFEYVVMGDIIAAHPCIYLVVVWSCGRVVRNAICGVLIAEPLDGEHAELRSRVKGRRRKALPDLHPLQPSGQAAGAAKWLPN